MSEEKKLNGTVIVTYRCNARCSMCNRYKAPSKPEEEISIETIKKLPKMYFTNITGGEPFIRTDLKDILKDSDGACQSLTCRIPHDSVFKNFWIVGMKKFERTVY